MMRLSVSPDCCVPSRMAETKVIHRLRPWKTADAVEWGTLKWVDWFNNRRLLQPIGNIPPAEAEEKFYEQQNEFDKVARNGAISLRENRGGSGRGVA